VRPIAFNSAEITLRCDDRCLISFAPGQR